MKRTLSSELRHDKKVRSLANTYQKSGYEVKAALSDWTPPEKINGHIPDIIATKETSQTLGGLHLQPKIERIIIEVETVDSVNDPHSEAQANAFNRAVKSGEYTDFKPIIA